MNMNILINSILKDAELIRERELQKALKLLADKIGVEEKRLIENFSCVLMRSILSRPITNIIKESQSNVEDHYSLIDVASLLFKYK
jgi:glutamyl-tRNA reductase